ncbi:ABC transporter ATP-binding protein [Halovenus sp. HT40]|uniref:ABC transporter ATP-binding protein n=1 Tax=Halovenus sp. HT40 TaxID=3126691 RepID=UPI00300E86BE
MIDTTNLTKRFDEETAVEGLDLSVEEGSVHGFVGPNGAGKTTTMKMLVGLLEPTEGEALIDDEPAGSVAAKRRIGYSPQELSLYDSMTARRYLRFMGRTAGMSKADARERSDELLEWIDLEDAADRAVGGYSGGMKRRVSLAQAMIHDPDLLILDEPTTGLDPAGRQTIMDALESLPEEGMTVFVSSHVLAELEQYIDSVTIVRDGTHVVTDSIDAVQDEHGGEAFAIETDDNERVRAILADHALVNSVEVDDEELLVMTEQPDEFRQQFQQLLVDEGISLRSLTEEGTLQEAFTDIIEAGDAE